MDEAIRKYSWRESVEEENPPINRGAAVFCEMPSSTFFEPSLCVFRTEHDSERLSEYALSLDDEAVQAVSAAQEARVACFAIGYAPSGRLRQVRMEGAEAERLCREC